MSWISFFSDILPPAVVDAASSDTRRYRFPQAVNFCAWAGQTLEVRHVRARARSRAGKMRNLYIAIKLTDAQKYPDEKIAALYMQRWKIDVKFRDIKTTLGLEASDVWTPEMAANTMRMVQVT